MSCDITTLVDRFRNNVLDVRFMLIVNLELGFKIKCEKS